jgi:hypothetical protein
MASSAHYQTYEQSIIIHASTARVERCILDQELMHRWLNPALKCEPIKAWDTSQGGRSRFVIQTPFWQPTLISTVVEREVGLIVWAFEGFFQGQDRWQWQPTAEGTCVLNQFQFAIQNPVIRVGFDIFASGWTRRDMQSQLQRLKQLAETLPSKN